MWVGETPKNIAATFRAAVEQNAVLLFDEADAIATRRSAGATWSHDHTKAVRDITAGNNGTYEAAKGWDACSGIGVPVGSAMLSAAKGQPKKRTA